MMKMKWKVVLVGAMVAGLGLTACVDDNPSMLMKGSVVGAAEAGSCTYSLDFDGQESFYTQGYVDLASLSGVGQPLVGGREGGLGTDYFYFSAIFINQLLDSRTVGAEGGGGGGGGFQNLPLDQNDIQITSATVTFPSDLNSFNFASGAASFDGDEQERLFSALLASNEGVAVTRIPLIAGPDEVALFDAFLRGNGVAGRPLTFIAQLQLHGETMAGNKVESNIYQYPVQICADCDTTSQALCQAGGDEEPAEEEEEDA